MWDIFPPISPFSSPYNPPPPPRHIRQPEIPPTELVRQPLVVETQQVQRRGVEIVDMHAVLDRVIADVVGGPVDEASLHAAARHPDRIAVGVVIAAVIALR